MRNWLQVCRSCLYAPHVSARCFMCGCGFWKAVVVIVQFCLVEVCYQIPKRVLGCLAAYCTGTWQCGAPLTWHHLWKDPAACCTLRYWIWVLCPGTRWAGTCTQPAVASCSSNTCFSATLPVCMPDLLPMGFRIFFSKHIKSKYIKTCFVSCKWRI